MPVGTGQKIVIVGSGLAGGLLACALARLGFQVELYERRPDPRTAGYSGGRSINLALSDRGLDALRSIGLDQRVMQQDALPMKGRMMHAYTGDLTYQPYSADAAHAINSVSRAGLNLTLINEAATYSNVRLVFESTCIDADPLTGTATLRSPDGTLTTAQGDLLVAADGAFSAVRGIMQRTDRYNYQQSYLDYGYKELHIPPAAQLPAGAAHPDRFGGFALDPAALHIWPRRKAMMIALPNRDKSFTCTLFWPFQGDHSFEALDNPDKVRAHFQRHYPDAFPLIPNLADDFKTNPTGSLVTIRCWPWVMGRAVLLGDAAHAIVPFYGQGMNAAFEDCKALAECLDRARGQIAPALDEFQTLRKPHADAIADLALANFVEMRDKVGTRLFLYKKKLEHALHRRFPTRFTPLYDMVSFSLIPYNDARRRAAQQWQGFSILAFTILFLILLSLQIILTATGIIPSPAAPPLGLLLLCLYAVGVSWLWQRFTP